MMIRDAIRKIVDGENLSEQDAAEVMTEIMDGEATPSQIASFVTGLRLKGETIEEITGFVRVMRDKSHKVSPNRDTLVDTCGTGGDKLSTYNISTTAAFIAAGAGATIAKHGNRAASSTCGSADVLEGIGANINLTPEQVAMCIDIVGIGFMFAPAMHPAMKHAVAPRREIGIRTVFNILGPMTNPAGAKRQVIGVFSQDFTEKMAYVLRALGSERAMVLHGMHGLDEISTLGETVISELVNGEIRTYGVTPEQFGIPRVDVSDLDSGDNTLDKVSAMLGVLHGEKGPRRDIAVLNAAAALVVADKADSIANGIDMASGAIDNGAAVDTLERFKAFTREIAQK